MARKAHYTDVKFGYDDGSIRTVSLSVGEMQEAQVVLKGPDLDMVTAMYFHLHGYGVSPGLKSYGFRSYKNCFTTTAEDQRLNMGREVKVCRMPKKRWNEENGCPNEAPRAIHWSLSVTETRPGTLRLWAQSTMDGGMWLNFMFNKKDTKEFGRRLAFAAQWDVEGMEVPDHEPYLSNSELRKFMKSA